MTKIIVTYNDDTDVVYDLVSNTNYVEKYWLKDGCITFDCVDEGKNYEMLIPFSNVYAIKIYEEDNKANESKDIRNNS